MRKLLITGLLIGLSSIAAATPATTSMFQGFYVGANATFNSLAISDKFTANFGRSSVEPLPSGIYSNSTSHTSYSYGENLFAGYNFQLTNSFLLGVEARVLAANKVDHAEITTAFSLPPAQQPPSSIFLVTARDLTIDGGAINLLVKPEFLLGAQQMIYALFGSGYAKMHLNNNFGVEMSGVSLAIGGIHLNKTAMPFTFGLGYAQYLTTNLSWSAEISDMLYPDIKGDVATAASPVIPQTFSYHAEATNISMVSANLGLSYHFKGV